MTGQTFYWIAVFESFTAIDITQEEAVPGFSEAVTTRQAVAQRWNRSGTVNISPGQATEDVIKDVVLMCKQEGGGIPADALLVGINLLPNVLVPR
ncbi:hypothetical protein SEA_KEANU_92 [Streptomyces phage Keanu]|nr:hypothetical protein SEA_KEANU_92 [Streptomyces phage Keanu]